MTFWASRISDLWSLSRSVTPWALRTYSIYAVCSFVSRLFFQSSPQIHDHRWGSEQSRFKSWNLCGLWNYPFRHYGAIKSTQNQGRIQSGATVVIAPLKTTNVSLFTIIVYNSENNIRDISPFCHLLFCHGGPEVHFISLTVVNP